MLRDPSIAVVGGRQAARPSSQRLIAQAIGRALNNPLANGGARYRNHRSKSGPCDTAYLGAFRTDQLRSVDGWAVEFASNQDFELSRRMSRLGTVWYEAGLPVGYQPRDSMSALLQQYRRFGRWKAIYWKRTGDRPRPRQLVLLAGPGLALAAAATAPALACTVGVSSLLAVDHVGAERAGSIGERLGSCVAMATIGFGWWTGALQEMLTKKEPTR